MPPSASASATSRFGRLASMPAKCPPSSSTSRQACPSLRPGAAVGSSHTVVPGAFSPSIAPGVGAMRRHLAAVFQHDVGEESFIPAQQRAADQGAGEAHRRYAAPRPRARTSACPTPPPPC